jgi:hypothetical protein
MDIGVIVSEHSKVLDYIVENKDAQNGRADVMFVFKCTACGSRIFKKFPGSYPNAPYEASCTTCNKQNRIILPAEDGKMVSIW